MKWRKGFIPKILRKEERKEREGKGEFRGKSFPKILVGLQKMKQPIFLIRKEVNIETKTKIKNIITISDIIIIIILLSKGQTSNSLRVGWCYLIYRQTKISKEYIYIFFLCKEKKVTSNQLIICIIIYIIYIIIYILHYNYTFIYTTIYIIYITSQYFFPLPFFFLLLFISHISFLVPSFYTISPVLLLLFFNVLFPFTQAGRLKLYIYTHIHSCFIFFSCFYKFLFFILIIQYYITSINCKL